MEEPVTLPLALGKAVHRAIEDKIKGIPHSEAVLNGLVEAEFHNEVMHDDISWLTRNAPVSSGMGETEVHFVLPLSDSSSTPKLQGYIDLTTNDGKKIIDWKTNRRMYYVKDNHQLGLYAWATSFLSGVNKVEGSLYFLRFRRKSRFIYDKEEMNEARLWALNLANEIDSKLFLLDIQASNPEMLFPAKPSSYCGHCPFAIKCYEIFQYNSSFKNPISTH